MKKRMVSLLLGASLVASTLTGCGGNVAETSATGTKYKKFITVDVYDKTANYQGIQSGWFGELVKQKFNMELNIIAPNVAGGGDTLFQTRCAAGDLGDLIITETEHGKLENLVKAGLMLDMTDLLKDKDVYKNYKMAIDKTGELAKQEGMWAVPSSISNQPADTPSEGLDLTFGPYLRWDIYKEIGYPKMDTLEDMLPVLKKMQETKSTADNGKKTYALSLFKDWDDKMMNNAKQPTCFYGYDEIGFVLSKADGTDDQSIIEDDSMYMRVLKFFFDANQMGLVDPDSTTQNFDTLSTKYREGQVLYAPWPWLGQSLYNSLENKKAGKGFMLAPISDMKIFSYGCRPQGNPNSIIGIGSKAEDPQRLADFIDWLYSPEGVCASQSFTTGGPEGMGWEMKDGRPVLTEFGKQALPQNDIPVPTQWGGGSWKDGVCALNFVTCALVDNNPVTGAPYNYSLWESVLEENTTPLDVDWKEEMQANTTLEFLRKNNMLLVAPGCNYLAPEEDSNITTIRNQCKATIVELSWKMIFAQDEKEFNTLKKNMQDTVKGLGYDQVLAVDLQNAKDQNALRVEALAASK